VWLGILQAILDQLERIVKQLLSIKTWWICADWGFVTENEKCFVWMNSFVICFVTVDLD
jgi:hypothetical protein